MAALDAARIEKARVAADQRAARKHEFGQALQTARGQRARAVGNAFAAFEEAANARMGLVALELVERRKIRIRITEADHETDRDLVVFEVVQERAAVGVVRERPARGMDDQPRHMLGRVDLPEFLDADAMDLRIAARIELVARDELLAQMAARTFGKHRVLGMQFHADLKIARRLAVAADAHVAGGYALDRALFVEQHFGRGEAGEDLDAERFGLLAQPAHDIAQADDVIAVVLEAARQHPMRHMMAAGFVEEQEPVFGHGLIQGRAALFPVGEEFVERTRVHDRTRQDVGSELRAFFDHADIDVRIDLLEADGGGEAAGATANHDHIVFHRFARAVFFHELLLNGDEFGIVHALSP